MIRAAMLGLGLLAACKPTPPVASGPRAPTLSCTATLPPGWFLNASPMPDHILEALGPAPALQGRLIVREADDTVLTEAVADEKRRTVSSWGLQSDFQLVREEPLAGGRLLVYRWRPQAGAPLGRHLVLLLPAHGKVVRAIAADDGSTDEAPLVVALGSLTCKPK